VNTEKEKGRPLLFFACVSYTFPIIEQAVKLDALNVCGKLFAKVVLSDMYYTPVYCSGRHLTPAG
jgi:hypothetical protein